MVWHLGQHKLGLHCMMHMLYIHTNSHSQFMPMHTAHQTGLHAYKVHSYTSHSVRSLTVTVASLLHHREHADVTIIMQLGRTHYAAGVVQLVLCNIWVRAAAA